jgi:hypothetical protein
MQQLAFLVIQQQAFIMGQVFIFEPEQLLLEYHAHPFVASTQVHLTILVSFLPQIHSLFAK